MVGGRQTARPGTNDEYAFAAGGCGYFELPILLNGQIAEKTLNGVNADRRIQLAAIAGILTGVITHPAVDARHRVVLGQDMPSCLEMARLGMGQPGLDILTGWAGIIAGGK
jgi:hypothetical protein